MVSLGNTGEPLCLVNRRGSRPSHEGAAARFDQSIALCQRAGFKRVLLRGDTDFTQTKHLDGWPSAGVRFIFGLDAMQNLIEQLTNGARALQMPVDNLLSNWAYMAMASLAWTLKTWFALLLPERGRWKEKHGREKATVLRMEFKRFVNAFVRVPCQVLRTGRRLVYRLPAWNPWQHVSLRGVDALHTMSVWRHPLRC